MRRAGGWSLQQGSPQAFAVVIGPRGKELILYSQQRTAYIRSLFKYEAQTGKKNKLLCVIWKLLIAPAARDVEMWDMGTDSRMTLDIGTCRGALEGSGGTSKGGDCCSAGLSASSVLIFWLWDRAGLWDSETGGMTGDVTGEVSSGPFFNSEIKRKALLV